MEKDSVKQEIKRLVVQMSPGICHQRGCARFDAHVHEKCPKCFVVDNYRKDCLTCIEIYTLRMKFLEQEVLRGNKECASDATFGKQTVDARKRDQDSV